MLRLGAKEKAILRRHDAAIEVLEKEPDEDGCELLEWVLWPSEAVLDAERAREVAA